MLIDVDVAAVIRPLPFTVKDGTSDAEPKLPTLLLTVARVETTDPVPDAETSPVRDVMPPPMDEGNVRPYTVPPRAAATMSPDCSAVLPVGGAGRFATLVPPKAADIPAQKTKAAKMAIWAVFCMKIPVLTQQHRKSQGIPVSRQY